MFLCSEAIFTLCKGAIPLFGLRLTVIQRQYHYKSSRDQLLCRLPLALLVGRGQSRR
jgi:hypothetical protein